MYFNVKILFIIYIIYFFNIHIAYNKYDNIYIFNKRVQWLPLEFPSS